MASASPYVAFGVARCLEGVPYIMDYRDAWAFNTITGAEDFNTGSERGKLEAQFLAEAAGSWFVNDQIRDEYAARYPESAATMRVVPNGFDPQPGHAAPGIRQTQHPRFGYLGTLQYVNMPMAEFLQGWGMAFPAPKPRPRRCSAASSVPRARPAPRSLRPSVSASRNGLTYEGPISKRDVARFYGSRGRAPVVAVHRKVCDRGQDRRVPGDRDADRLGTRSGQRRHGAAPRLSVVVSGQGPHSGSIAAALQECADALAHPDSARWDAAWEYGQKFARSAILAPVIAELRQLVGQPLQRPLAEEKRNPLAMKPTGNLRLGIVVGRSPHPQATLDNLWGRAVESDETPADRQLSVTAAYVAGGGPALVPPAPGLELVPVVPAGPGRLDGSPSVPCPAKVVRSGSRGGWHGTTVSPVSWPRP